ncbi:MAG: polysaccharide deacetylase family protein [Anaerolineales bacterium]|nr:polysaccharide deacetylase family protein [Anaerolineales bacterium]
MKKHTSILLLLSMLLSACQATMEIAPDPQLQTQTAVAASLPTQTPPPTPTSDGALLPEAVSAVETSGAATPDEATPDPTEAPPTTEAAPTITATIDPSDVEVSCRTPMSLMLHSAFGAERMAALADEIEVQNLRTITYHELYQMLISGRCPAEDVILVSIDDLGSNWLRYDFQEMIRVFTERNMVLTVGVVTKGPQNEANWEYFREIASLGIEIASHSMNHYDLTIITDEALEEEVSGSYRIICDNMGTCPDTFIIPFGRVDEDGRVIEALNEYKMLVGIQGWLEISGKPPFLLGRIPPDNDNQQTTIAQLKATYSVSE